MIPFLRPEPLSQKVFSRFGQVLAMPPDAGRRAFFDGSLVNGRADAWPSLSLVHGTAAPRPISITRMERHPHSSQTVLPLAMAAWVVIVAPEALGGGPDFARACAFLPKPGQGITLARGIWHAPLTVLEGAAPFALLMWRDGGSEDEEFASIAPLHLDL